MGRIFYNGSLYSGNASHNYSTDEQVVGTWIDGRTVYEKTIVFSTPLSLSYNTWTDTDIVMGEASNGWNIIRSNGIDIYGGSIGALNTTPYSTNGKFSIINLRNATISLKSITVQYTKSSS